SRGTRPAGRPRMVGWPGRILPLLVVLLLACHERIDGSGADSAALGEDAGPCLGPPSGATPAALVRAYVIDSLSFAYDSFAGEDLDCHATVQHDDPIGCGKLD